MSDRLRARLVARSIDEQQALRNRPPLLLVKLLRERGYEEAERLAVGVRLRHRTVEAPACANSQLHCDSRTHAT